MIRKMHTEDKKEVDNLLKQAYIPFKSIYKVIPGNSSGDFEYETIIYQLEGKIVGTLSYYFDNSVIRLFKMAIDPDFQNQGIGRELITYIESSYKSKDLNKLGVYIIKETGNEKIFNKLGFQVVSETIATFALALDGKHVSELEMIKAF